MLHTRKYLFVTKFNLLSNKQYGFRKNYATTLAFYSVYHDILNKMDLNLYNRCKFLDHRIAFDIVNHSILIKKNWKSGTDNKLSN